MEIERETSHEERQAGGGGGRGNGLVAVAVDHKDYGSRFALKWALENPLFKCETVILIHVDHNPISASAMNHPATRELNGAGSAHRPQLERQTKDFLLPFRAFCIRKNVQCLDVILEDTDIVKALLEYVSSAAIEKLILGASSSRLGCIRRFMASDVPSKVSKGAPDFCSVYVISKKAKISSMRKSQITSQAALGIPSERVKSSYLIFILFPLPFFWFAAKALFEARKDSARTS